MQYFLGLRHPLQHRMKQYQIDRAFQMLRNILSRALYKMHVVDHTFIGGRLAGASHHLSGEIAERHVMAQLRDFDGRLPFAAAGIPLDRPVLQEAVVQLGTVPVAPFALPGSQGVADSVAPYCRDYRALLLEYHGAVTWGETMERAYFRLECLEQMANVTLHLKTLGCDRVMPESLVKELEGLRPAWGIR